MIIKSVGSHTLYYEKFTIVYQNEFSKHLENHSRVGKTDSSKKESFKHAKSVKSDEALTKGTTVGGRRITD